MGKSPMFTRGVPRLARLNKTTFVAYAECPICQRYTRALVEHNERPGWPNERLTWECHPVTDTQRGVARRWEALVPSRETRVWW